MKLKDATNNVENTKRRKIVTLYCLNVTDRHFVSILTGVLQVLFNKITLRVELTEDKNSTQSSAIFKSWFPIWPASVCCIDRSISVKFILNTFPGYFCWKMIRETRNIFLRGVAVVYLFAFLSFYLQIPGKSPGAFSRKHFSFLGVSVQFPVVFL